MARVEGSATSVKRNSLHLDIDTLQACKNYPDYVIALPVLLETAVWMVWITALHCDLHWDGRWIALASRWGLGSFAPLSLVISHFMCQ